MTEPMLTFSCTVRPPRKIAIIYPDALQSRGNTLCAYVSIIHRNQSERRFTWLTPLTFHSERESQATISYFALFKAAEQNTFHDNMQIMRVMTPACNRRETNITRARASGTRHEMQDRLYTHGQSADYGGGPVEQAVIGPSREPDETSPPGKNVPGLLLLYGPERREPRPSHSPLQNRSRHQSWHAHRRHLLSLAAHTGVQIR